MAITPNVFRQLLKDARIGGARAEAMIEQALSRDYWRSLLPALTIEASPESAQIPDEDRNLDTAARSAKADGYFKLPRAVSDHEIRTINSAIDRLGEAGWPPAFVFLYDAGWNCARAPLIRKALTQILGPDARQIQHVWVHVVPAAHGASGWRPHVDGEGGRRMTVWLALTEATLDNGCMHVLPRSHVSAVPNLAGRLDTPGGTFVRDEVSALLHGTRALVADPGDALGWYFDVVHWGGFAHASAHERRSFSFEYIAADEPPNAHDGVTRSLDHLPTFEERLASVCRSIDAYRVNDPAVDRFVDVARGVLARLQPNG